MGWVEEEEEAVKGLDHGADSRTEASGRSCPLVRCGGRAVIRRHVRVRGWQPWEGRVCGETPALGGPIAHRTASPPLALHSRLRAGFSQPSLPASLPLRCLMFCLLVPTKCSLGISTSGPGVPSLPTRLRPPRPAPGSLLPEPVSPSPRDLSLPRVTVSDLSRDLESLEGRGPMSSFGSPHRLSTGPEARYDLHVVLHALAVF